jgi:hypothetical protein
MARARLTKIPCRTDQVEDPDRPGVCIDIVPIFSASSTVFQGPDCWPLSVTVPTGRLGPFVRAALTAEAQREFAGLSRNALRRKLKELTGRRARMKKKAGAAKKARAK